MVRKIEEIEVELKKQNFEVYYRSVKYRSELARWLPDLIRKNDEFFRENPGYVEGAMCGKLKENK